MKPPFAAVLLAGGKSRRMGRDKAFLSLPDGRRLWERQRDVLRELEPAEWFISGAWREGFSLDLPWLADALPGCGPLMGIAAALKAMRSPRLVVLAVDLPAMNDGFLRGLLEKGNGAGIVPQRSDGCFEPLAAVYPHAASDAAEECLRRGAFALQPFVRALVRDGLACARPIMETEAGLFANWNDPADLPS